jgi:hypothetical protein
MTLHEAIEQVLVISGKSMTAVEIASAINKNSSYTKGDGSMIKSSQISARVKNYPLLFTKTDSFIALKSISGVKVIKSPLPQPTSKIKVEQIVNQDIELLCKVLMNEKNFKSANDIDNLIPDEPGLYCIRIKDHQLLHAPYNTILKERKHNIIYIGIASQSLKKRFLGQELRAKGHGTFFRSIGAVLGFAPEPGSLIDKKNQNNYTFSSDNEKKIIQWMNQNLVVNWVKINQDFNSIENDLIKAYLPLINIAGNPGALKELSDLRDRCKRISRG